jgi:hypothetical protein
MTTCIGGIRATGQDGESGGQVRVPNILWD